MTRRRSGTERTVPCSVMFHNVAGFVVQRNVAERDALPRFFEHRRPDVLCLVEVPMDDEGRSPEVAAIAQACGFAHTQVMKLHRSHLASHGGWLGLAVLSQYPIVHGAVAEQVWFGDLDLDPPGRVAHRKGAQVLRLLLDQASGTMLRLVSLHLPAVYLFGRRIDDPEFYSLHSGLQRVIFPGGRQELERTVVCGDFNNREIPIAKAFPGLEIGRRLRKAVTVQSTVLGVPGAESDHILVSPDIDVCEGVAWLTSSDHVALGARLSIRLASAPAP